MDGRRGELDVGGWGGACASRFCPNARAKMFPPIMGARETKPQFSEKCAVGNEDRPKLIVRLLDVLQVNEVWLENHARRPNHSMVIVGNNPKRLPYAMPRTALAFQRLSGSSVV